jgi:hypothetical protein
VTKLQVNKPLNLQVLKSKLQAEFLFFDRLNLEAWFKQITYFTYSHWLYIFLVCLYPLVIIFIKSMLTQTHRICLLAWHSISKPRLDSVNTRTDCFNLFLPLPKAMEIINNSSVSCRMWFVMEPIGKSVINMFSPITMACLGASI